MVVVGCGVGGLADGFVEVGEQGGVEFGFFPVGQEVALVRGQLIVEEYLRQDK